MKVKRKQHLSLIEVLIAFALVVMCILPLIYPHVFMVKTQHQFIRKIELDHAVNVLYGDTLAALQMNRIPWKEIIDGKRIPITEDQLKAAGLEDKLLYQGSYQFSIQKKKPEQESPETAYLLNLTYSFVPTLLTNDAEKQKKTLHYSYQVFLVYGQETTPEPEENNPADDHQEEK